MDVSDSESDWATTIAAGLLAYLVSCVAHELVGHGLACILRGDHAVSISSLTFQCDRETPTMLAGGSVLNLSMAVAAWFALQRAEGGALRWFLWVALAVNAFGPALYLVLSPLAGFGDWHEFALSFGRPMGLVVALSGSGALLGFVAWPLVRRQLSSLCAGDTRTARRRVLPIYVLGAIAFAASALLGPQRWEIFGFAMALGFVGFGPLAAAALVPVPKTDAAQPVRITRSWPWLATTGAFLLVFFAVLGPGIHFR
ncbi:MAG: hypothetical protein ACXWUE_21670 [Polyangiales bacterium]